MLRSHDFNFKAKHSISIPNNQYFTALALFLIFCVQLNDVIKTLKNITMQQNIIWSGKKFQSLENCRINTTASGFEISSNIIGIFNNKIVNAEYIILTTKNWKTRSFQIDLLMDGNKITYEYESDTIGNWTTKGEPVVELNDCIDIDISLTPFTNTLPINRLIMNENDQQEINVVYIDLLEQKIKNIQQRYTKQDADRYLYQNITIPYEATLIITETGLVKDYPHVFEMEKLEEFE